MKFQKNIPFTVNHAVLDQSYSFDTAPPCRCNTNHLCLVHQNSGSPDPNLKSFPISRRLERREIKDTPDYKILLAQAKNNDIILEDAIPINQTRYNLLQLICFYQDMEAIHLKDILSTDLITHQIQPRERYFLP